MSVAREKTVIDYLYDIAKSLDSMARSQEIIASVMIQNAPPPKLPTDEEAVGVGITNAFSDDLPRGGNKQHTEEKTKKK